ncbi:hypothetical protein EVAR_99718_1 [Eumeta japonica]|uniref:Uncharacterized protein n=1 Tax=Eumeta variegata TaxID=151549 RepID=A0A4C1ZNP5_EUMVA|nr:hypothetical protein EVAR_99718_1 [Eumeta japonica]
MQNPKKRSPGQRHALPVGVPNLNVEEHPPKMTLARMYDGDRRNVERKKLPIGIPSRAGHSVMPFTIRSRSGLGPIKSRCVYNTSSTISLSRSMVDIGQFHDLLLATTRRKVYDRRKTAVETKTYSRIEPELERYDSENTPILSYLRKFYRTGNGPRSQRDRTVNGITVCASALNRQIAGSASVQIRNEKR